MKRFLYSVVTAALVGAVTVGLVPEKGSCQMAYGSIFAVGCRMPCCSGKMPMPHCPMVKPQAPRDFIASMSPILKVGLIPLHLVAAAATSKPQICTRFIATITEVVQLTFAGPPPSLRAPPTLL